MSKKNAPKTTILNHVTAAALGTNWTKGKTADEIRNILLCAKALVEAGGQSYAAKGYAARYGLGE